MRGSSPPPGDRPRAEAAHLPEGVAHLWFVNPVTRTLEVLRLSDKTWVVVATHDGDATVRAEPFDAVPLELFRVWGRSAPEP
jgi:hypothetical protein